MNEIEIKEKQITEKTEKLEKEVHLNTKVTDIILKVSGLHEYQFVTKKLTRRDAEVECVKWGGHLVSILSKQENDYFQSEEKKKGIIGNTWIGLTEVKQGENWNWKSGMKNAYTNWGSGYPRGVPSPNVTIIDQTRQVELHMWYLFYEQVKDGQVYCISHLTPRTYRNTNYMCTTRSSEIVISEKELNLAPNIKTYLATIRDVQIKNFIDIVKIDNHFLCSCNRKIEFIDGI